MVFPATFAFLVLTNLMPALYGTNVGGKSHLIGDYHKIKECRHGNFLLNNHDSYVGRSLDLYGEWSEEELNLFTKFIEPGDLVIDVGANIGAFTIPFAKIVGEMGTVHSFEPKRVLSQMLAANAMLNELHNVVVHHAGVGNKTSPLKVPKIAYNKGDTNFGGVSLLSDWKEFGSEVETVDQIQLDDEFYIVGNPCPSFIKVDVEGMELDVLSGARKLLKECRPVLHVENNCIMGSAEVITFISGFGYDLYWDVHSYFNKNNFFQHQTSVFPDRSFAINIICIPKGRDISEIKELQQIAKIDADSGKLTLHEYNLTMTGMEDSIIGQIGGEPCGR